jgi:hypothetical protein
MGFFIFIDSEVQDDVEQSKVFTSLVQVYDDDGTISFPSRLCFPVASAILIISLFCTSYFIQYEVRMQHQSKCPSGFPRATISWEGFGQKSQHRQWIWLGYVPVDASKKTGEPNSSQGQQLRVIL